MTKQLLIKDVMTEMPHTIGIDQTVDAARTIMRKYTIRHLPVQKGGELVGIVSDRDIQFAVAWEHDPVNMIIDDVYTPEPYIVAPDTPVKFVAEEMANNSYGSVLVVEHGRLVGIFTTVDACRVLAKQL